MLFQFLRDSNGGTKMANGYSAEAISNSPNSSQISGDGSGHHSNDGGPTLISRTQKQHTTQQVLVIWTLLGSEKFSRCSYTLGCQKFGEN